MSWTENIPTEDGYYYAAICDAKVKVFIANLYNADTLPVIMVTRDAPLDYGIAHNAGIVDYWGDKIEMPEPPKTPESVIANIKEYLASAKRNMQQKPPVAGKSHLGMKCLTCNTVIFSEHRHDFVWCGCKLPEGKGEGYAVFVDGGYNYFRNGAGPRAKFKFMERLPDGNVREFRNNE